MLLKTSNQTQFAFLLIIVNLMQTWKITSKMNISEIESAITNKR
jgi:hypothetical protein